MKSPGPGLLAGLLAAALACAGCGGDGARIAAGDPGDRPRLVVVGVDGAEWGVIRKLWGEGKLPNLKALAERGVSSPLATDYGSSPVIWSSIATGMKPERHGITGFVVPSAKGDVPVSSTVRRVPAIWNMLTTAQRRVAVIGWWASWPAEPVNGVVVSDRALLDLPGRVSPAGELPELETEIAQAEAEPTWFQGSDIATRRDEIAARYGVKLAPVGYDLLLVYFRSVDIACHNYWKYYEPDSFPDVPPGEVAAFKDVIPAAYESMDAALGGIVRAAGPKVNVVVLSDHGFEALDREKVKVVLDLDRVLEAMGYLTRGSEGIDFARTQVYSYSVADHQQSKLVRFALAGREEGGAVAAADRDAVRARLTRELHAVRYSSGAPAFEVRDARRKEAERGGDFVVEILPEGATETLLFDGNPVAGIVEKITIVSGGHDPHRAGIFVAAGPDVDTGADLHGIGIHDMAPTFLAALGLPVAEDFDGRAWTELFTPGFRARHPIREIASWGGAEPGEATASEADPELLDELRGLGYIE